MNKIPTTLDEAVSAIIEMSSSRDKEHFLRQRDLSIYHNTLGRWIRNEWVLWGDGSELKKWFQEKGLFHADDMSSVILDATQSKLKNEEFDLDREIGVYKQYWEKMNKVDGKLSHAVSIKHSGKEKAKVAGSKST